MLFKGIVSQEFLPLVSFLKHLLLGNISHPEVFCHGDISKFNVDSAVSMTALSKIFFCKSVFYGWVSKTLNSAVHSWLDLV